MRRKPLDTVRPIRLSIFARAARRAIRLRDGRREPVSWLRSARAARVFAAVETIVFDKMPPPPVRSRAERKCSLQRSILKTRP